ncbi:MAG: phosphotransferase [Eubacterium sp.]|nr:phosphotransferase [Eubacterium sp.]
MINKNQFNVLFSLLKIKNESITQRKIAEATDFSLGKVNSVLNELKEERLINQDYRLTEEGLNALKPYKVKNAVIMAAGMSTRFAPLSFENPKALINVRGEKLIEREINQLHDAGINDITVVVGYMQDKLFYLAEKYGVKIVINEDYFRYNNTSTLIRVLDQLDNTYICSSDNYFTENVFEPYVYRAYYSAQYCDGETDEYLLVTDNSDKITDVLYGGRDSWYMIGHAYFDRAFSGVFKRLLKAEYHLAEVKENLWENFLKAHLGELDIYIRKYKDGVIYEFDSLDELRQFDENYISNINSTIMDNICKVLKCDKKDIHRIEPIKNGLTNSSFSFLVKDKKYVYRHPGAGTENYINRESEASSMHIAKSLGLDDTFIYIDSEKGWKISEFVEDARTLDYHNDKEVDTALDMVRKLHNCGEDTGFKFDIFTEINNFYERLPQSRKTEELTQMLSDIHKLKDYLDADNVSPCLCHSDCYDPNFLIDKSGKMYLIDWEYSGMADPASDLGTFIACSDYTYDEAKDIIKRYLRHEPESGELAHYVGYVAVLSFYWYIWSIYQDTVGNPVGEWQYLWYKSSLDYTMIGLEMYN